LPEEQKKHVVQSTTTSKAFKQDTSQQTTTTLAETLPVAVVASEVGMEKSKNCGISGASANVNVNCEGPDCWTQVMGGPDGPTSETGFLVIAPSAGLSLEQGRIVELFFALYKNHAAPHSCCRAWFSRQVNKISAMLKAAKSVGALLSLVEWMNRHQIVVEPTLPPATVAFTDPDSGFLLPPMTSAKGPLFRDQTIAVSSVPSPEPVLIKEGNERSLNCACLKISYTRDEVCTVRVSEKFEELFGRDASYFSGYLDTLNGGILPWGADVFANLLYRPIDTVLLMRLLAYRFQAQPRMTDSRPLRRQVQSSHIFACMKADGTVIDCIVRLNHVEDISFEGVAVEVTAAFEPYTSLAPVTCDFGNAAVGLPAQTPMSTTPVTDTSDQTQDVSTPFPEKGQPGDFSDIWIEDLLKWVDDPSVDNFYY
jgi:hypothetical protein